MQVEHLDVESFPARWIKRRRLHAKTIRLHRKRPSEAFVWPETKHKIMSPAWFLTPKPGPCSWACCGSQTLSPSKLQAKIAEVPASLTDWPWLLHGNRQILGNYILNVIFLTISDFSEKFVGLLPKFKESSFLAVWAWPTGLDLACTWEISI